MLAGSLGLLASASLGAGKAGGDGSQGAGRQVGLYEPIHGSAPDIAGKGVANPGALVLAAGMMLDHLGMPEQGERIRRAMRDTITAGDRLTRDLGGSADTATFTQALIGRL